MSLFPFIDGRALEAEQQSDTRQIPREYAWDFSSNDFVLKDGKCIVLEGLEAIKVWVYKALMTKRFIHPAYSWDYGHELDNLVGGNDVSRKAIESEAKRYIEEALLVNPNINSIANVVVNVMDNVLSLAFTIKTDYGEATINV